jgi:flagellar export protein FliJ
MAVPFRFDTVLRLREAERDRCQLAVAAEQRHYDGLVAQRDQIASQRESMRAELVALQASEGWTVDRVLSRQQHLEFLSAELQRVETAVSVARGQLDQLRGELLNADTAVKALEKLAERHTSQRRQAEQAKDERDRDDYRRVA